MKKEPSFTQKSLKQKLLNYPQFQESCRMNNSSSTTVTDGLNSLRLPSCKKEFIRQLNDVNMGDMCFEDRLCLIVDAEITSRKSNRSERKVREAQFKIEARPELISYDFARLPNKNRILSLLAANFIALG